MGIYELEVINMSLVRVASYSRFSSSNQREESIDAQQRAIHKYIQDKGYHLITDYKDEALTGTNTERPGFQKMLQDASQGLFDVVIVHKMDRFSRSVYDALNVQNQLLAYGVKIESVIEQFTDTPEGQLQQIVQLGVGQYYSANLAREVMKGLKENAFKALHNGGIPPLGYDVDPVTKRYVINEEEAKAIRIIYDKVIEGWSYSELAKYLNMLGYRTKLGRRFTATSSFYDLLTNPKYKGEYVFNRSVAKPKVVGIKRSHRKNKNENEIIRVKDGLPAIIDEQTFDLVQKLLKQRKQSKGQHKAKEVYLLSGLIKCGMCGSPYHGSSRVGGRNKHKYVTYRCSKRKQFETPCRCKEIDKELIDKFIVNQLMAILLQSDNIQTLHEMVNQRLFEKLATVNEDLPQLKKRLNEVSTQLSNLVQVIAVSGLNNVEAITQEIKRLEEEKTELLQQIEANQIKQESVTLTEEQLKQVLEEAKSYMLSNKDTQVKYILSRFIHQIIIYNEAIEVHYNLGGFFHDFKQVILIYSVRYQRLEIGEGMNHQEAI